MKAGESMQEYLIRMRIMFKDSREQEEGRKMEVYNKDAYWLMLSKMRDHYMDATQLFPSNTLVMEQTKKRSRN